MRTGLVRRYGERHTVPEYIDVVIKHHRCSEVVRTVALKMYNHIAQNTTFSGRYPSMLAMTIVYLASKECYNDIPSAAWTGDSTCSYNTLLIHSKELKVVLEKIEDFPNLKSRIIGR